MNVHAPFTLDGYDFVDFGCSSGGSMEFARNKLGGVRGLGLTKDEAKCQVLIEAGCDAAVADVTRLPIENLGSVRFVTITNHLQRLKTLDLARSTIQSACAIADEFVVIRQPFFDADRYLAALGLRLYWSNWQGHRNPMKAGDFQAILDDLLERRKIRRFILFNRTRIADSDDPAVHPLSSPADQGAWAREKHGPKPFYKFQVPVYREIGAVIHTRARKLDEKPRRFLLSCDVIADSAA